MTEENSMRTPQPISLAAKIILLTSSIPMSLALAALAPVLPKIEAALSHGDTDKMLVKMLIGIAGAAVVIGAPLAGVMGDRMNRARIITWALLIFSLAGASGYVIDSLWLMVGTRLLMGLAAAAVLTLGFAMAGDIPDDATRHRYTGWAVSIAAFSALIALTVGGMLGDINWRLVFLIFLTPLPIAIFSYRKYRAEGGEAPARIAKSAETDRVGFRLPIGLMLLALAGGIAQYIPLTYVSFYMRNIGISSSMMIGMALMAESVMVTIASSLFGAFRARVSAAFSFGVSFGLIGLGTAGVVLSHDLLMISACLCVVGVGAGWFTPNLVVATAEAADVSTRARYMGLVKGANMSATFLSILIAEPILRAGGVSAVLMSMAVPAVAASLFFFGLARIGGKRAEAACQT